MSGAVSAEPSPAAGGAPLVVYITCLPHSGSTLLDLLLGSHSAVEGLGEIAKLANYVKPDRLARAAAEGRSAKCTCGADPLPTCPMWADVDRRLQDTAGLGLADLNIQSRDNETFRRHNRLLVEAVAQATGCSVVVDSSKQAGRLARLRSVSDLTVVPLFLYRRPEGQIASMQRKYGRFLQRLVAYNRQTFRRTAGLQGQRYLAVRYEELCRWPEDTLARVMGALGLAFEPAQRRMGDVAHHNVGGNRTRFRATNELVLDERWRQELAGWQRLTAPVATLPARWRARRVVAGSALRVV